MIAVELRKLRRLKIPWLVAVLVVAVVALSSTTLFRDTDGVDMAGLLLAVTMAQALLSPVFVSIIASRLVEVEHEGNGWHLMAAAGVSRSRLCALKILLVSAIITVAVIVESTVLYAVAIGDAIPETVNNSAWWGYFGWLALVNIVFVVFHVVIAAKVDNQLVNIGIGVLGAFIAVFSLLLPDTITRFIPWGCYALISPVGFGGLEKVVYIQPPYASIIGLVAVMLVGGVVAVRWFDRLER
ncbi:MAG: ABC transporter permease [Corynebacterium sp.]|nr:ABC transporter permease [Corynebacterium sp.]